MKSVRAYITLRTSRCVCACVLALVLAYVRSYACSMRLCYVAIACTRV
jgi:hypothetical protein